MDNLRDIIQALSEEECREFRLFINRLRKKNNRKDLDLFEILKEESEFKPAAIINRLYKSSNKEAYHAVRKRLIRHLTDFIVLKNMEEDATAQSRVMGHVSLARYLFERRSPGVAWRYLLQGEELALANEHYETLNVIYNLMIEHVEKNPVVDLNDLIEKQRVNKELADEDERASIANSIVRHQLAEYRRHGQEMDFDKIITKTLADYKLQNAVLGRPRLLFNLISITRSAILAKKEFFGFESFIIRRFTLVEKRGAFAKKDLSYKLGILYMIAHVLYRNKKFAEAQEYLNQMNAALAGQSAILYSQFYPRYAQLMAAIHVFNNKLSDAKVILQELLDNKKLQLSHEDRLNALVNIGIYQFHENDYKSAHDTLLDIYHTDGWCEKIMGKEWVMKKGIMEVILYYELNHLDLAESRIRSVERKYSDLFDHPLYARAKVFLQLVKQFVQDPSEARTEAFAKKVESSFKYVPAVQEDIQAIGFYAWLKSKMHNRNYQEVLMEIVG